MTTSGTVSIIYFYPPVYRPYFPASLYILQYILLLTTWIFQVTWYDNSKNQNSPFPGLLLLLFVIAIALVDACSVNILDWVGNVYIPCLFWPLNFVWLANNWLEILKYLQRIILPCFSKELCACILGHAFNAYRVLV